MLWSEKARDGNREAEVDGRIRGREVAGIRQVARGAGLRSLRQLVRIRWDFTSGDLSEGELVDAAGNSLGRTVAVDGFTSLLAVQPQYFGDVIYECEGIGFAATTVSASKRRQKVRAVRFFGMGSGTVKRVFDILYAGVNYGKLRDLSGNVIQTTVHGAAGDNTMPILTPSGVTVSNGHSWDCHLPPMYALRNIMSGYRPSIVPDILRLSRRRGGYAAAAGQAGTGSGPLSLDCSIDLGEVYRIRLNVAGSFDNSPSFGGTEFNRWDFTFRHESSVAQNCLGVQGSVSSHVKVTTTTTEAAVAAGGTLISVSSGAISLTYDYGYNNAGTPTQTTTTVTFTFTVDATTGRLTNVTVTPSGPVSSAVYGSAILEGGRGTWSGATNGEL